MKRNDCNVSAKDPMFDLMLEIFMMIREEGKEYTYREIAEVIGCTHQMIYYYEQRALVKMQRCAIARGVVLA